MSVYDVDAAEAAALFNAAGTESVVEELIFQFYGQFGFDLSSQVDAEVRDGFGAIDGSVDPDNFDVLILQPGFNSVLIRDNGLPSNGEIVAGTSGGDVVITFADAGLYALGGGSDYLYDAGSGASITYSGDGADRLTNAGAGSDTLFAGEGDDFIADTGSGSSFIGAGDGSDTIFAGVGGDSVDGGAGDDAVVIYDGSAFVTGGDGNDLIYDQGSGNSVIYGGEGADTIFTGNGEDIVNGGAGDDIIGVFSFVGNDTVEGGDGSDLLILMRSSGQLVSTTDAEGGAKLLAFTDGTTLLYHGIESVVFAAA